MKISSKKLAEELNISPSTVSMVLNNKPGISPATRELVLNAAKAYGYVERKPQAEGPRTIIHYVIYQKKRITTEPNEFFSEILEGITQQCQKENLELHVSYIYGQDDVPEQLENLKRTVCTGMILLATSMTDTDFQMFYDFPVPIVVLDNSDSQGKFDCVQINNIQGAWQAVNYLIEMGHTRIGYLKGVELSNFQERELGYRKALSQHGLEVQEQYFHTIAPGAQSWEVFLEELNAAPGYATAYFADNDFIAFAAMRAFRQKGLRIPEDVSIIGFDDIPVSQILDPPLTTMHVHKQYLGSEAVRRLSQRMQLLSQASEAVEIPISIQVPASLVKRSSVVKIP